MAKGKKSGEQTLKNYLWLIETIYNAGDEGLTLEEISKQWQASGILSSQSLSRDTFNKRRSAIKNLFGIKMKCTRRNSKYYYSLERNNSFGAIGMINAFAANILVAKNPDLSNRIAYDEFESGKQFIIPILNAINEKKRMLIYHSDEYTGTLGNCKFKPLFLKLIRQKWYVYGYEYDNKEDNTHTSIPLDSISKVIPFRVPFQTDSEFSEDFDGIDDFITKYFSPINTVLPSNLSESKVELKVYGGLAGHIEQFPLHPIQSSPIKGDRNYTIFTYGLIPTDDFVGNILRYGDRIEVVAPVEFRDCIKKRIEQMQKRYEEVK